MTPSNPSKAIDFLTTEINAILTVLYSGYDTDAAKSALENAAKDIHATIQSMDPSNPKDAAIITVMQTFVNMLNNYQNYTKAEFEKVGAGTIQALEELKNLQAPTSISQALSDLDFVVSLIGNTLSKILSTTSPSASDIKTLIVSIGELVFLCEYLENQGSPEDLAFVAAVQNVINLLKKFGLMGINGNLGTFLKNLKDLKETISNNVLQDITAITDQALENLQVIFDQNFFQNASEAFEELVKEIQGINKILNYEIEHGISLGANTALRNAMIDLAATLHRISLPGSIPNLYGPSFSGDQIREALLKLMTPYFNLLKEIPSIYQSYGVKGIQGIVNLGDHYIDILNKLPMVNDNTVTITKMEEALQNFMNAVQALIGNGSPTLQDYWNLYKAFVSVHLIYNLYEVMSGPTQGSKEGIQEIFSAIFDLFNKDGLTFQEGFKAFVQNAEKLNSNALQALWMTAGLTKESLELIDLKPEYQKGEGYQKAILSELEVMFALLTKYQNNPNQSAEFFQALAVVINDFLYTCREGLGYRPTYHYDTPEIDDIYHRLEQIVSSDGYVTNMDELNEILGDLTPYMNDLKAFGENVLFYKYNLGGSDQALFELLLQEIQAFESAFKNVKSDPSLNNAIAFYKAVAQFAMMFAMIPKMHLESGYNSVLQNDMTNLRDALISMGLLSSDGGLVSFSTFETVLEGLTSEDASKLELAMKGAEVNLFCMNESNLGSESTAKKEVVGLTLALMGFFDVLEKTGGEGLSDTFWQAFLNTLNDFIMFNNGFVDEYYALPWIRTVPEPIQQAYKAFAKSIWDIGGGDMDQIYLFENIQDLQTYLGYYNKYSTLLPNAKVLLQAIKDNSNDAIKKDDILMQNQVLMG